FGCRSVTRIDWGLTLSMGDVRVSSPDELRSYAVDCARLAKAATDPHDKARLLNMARAWTDLADRIAKIGETAGKVALNAASPVDAPGISPAASSGPSGWGEAT